MPDNDANEAANNDTAPTRHLFTANNLPSSTSTVATELMKLPVAEQRTLASNLLEFLLEPTSVLLKLNAEKTPFTFLVHIPGTSNVQLCYGMGVGSSGIRGTSPLKGKFITLTGDGRKELGTPSVITFPTTYRTKERMGKMTTDQFTEAIAQVSTPDYYPLVANRNVTTTAEIMKICPIPPFLVYDGFEGLLDAENVYERTLIQATAEAPELYQHIQDFLLACLQSHTKNNPSPSLSIKDISGAPPNGAKQWAQHHFNDMFLALSPPQKQHTPPPPTDTLSAVLASVIPALTSQRQRTIQEEKKEEDTPLNMSTKERNQLGLMCGLLDGSEIDIMPQWIQDCAEKGTSDPYRYNILRVHIANHFKYEDAEVPLTLSLLKMIVKRNWLGKEGDPHCPSVAHAMEGLSPFTCAYMDSDKVAQQNIAENILDAATSVTPFNLEQATRKKAKALIPSSAEEFVHMLQAYANLLLALFSDTCPLFKAMVSIITALKSINIRARAAITMQARATILWIILLQSRRFAIGEMSILSEFSKMQSDLVGKNTNIHHAELPAELLCGQDPPLPPAPQKRPVPQPNTTNAPPPKKPKTPNPNAWHPKLKGAFEEAMSKAGNPPLTAIANYCGVNIKKMFQGFGDRCTSNAVLGRCYLGDKCTRMHEMPSEEEVENIKKMFQKFIDNPEGAKKGQ